MSTRSSKRTQASTSGRNKPQTSGRRPSPSGRSAAQPPAPARPSGRLSGRSAALAPEPAPASRASKRSAAVPASSASGRAPRASSRQSRRDLDVSNEYKSQRQSAAAKNKTFGTVVAIGIVIFMIISSIGLYVWYANTKGVIEDDQRRKVAFSDWLLTNQNTFKAKANAVATQMKSIIEDMPTEKSSDEVEKKMVASYGPTLSACGADYAWCKKTWNLKDKTYSLNISPNGAKEFLMTPATAAPLGDIVNIPNINGELSQSGVLSLFWDADRKAPVAVLQLNLAPPPVAQTGSGPAVKPIPPTSFYLWFPAEKIDGDALAHLLKITAPKAK